jgi:hypothetical protein
MIKIIRETKFSQENTKFAVQWDHDIYGTVMHSQNLVARDDFQFSRTGARNAVAVCKSRDRRCLLTERNWEPLCLMGFARSPGYQSPSSVVGSRKVLRATGGEGKSGLVSCDLRDNLTGHLRMCTDPTLGIANLTETRLSARRVIAVCNCATSKTTLCRRAKLRMYSSFA